MMRWRAKYTFSISLLLYCGIFCCAAFGETRTTINVDSVVKSIESGSASEKEFQSLSALVAEQPANARARYAMARYLEARGFEQLAIEQYGNAIALDATLGDAHYRRCLLYFRIQDFDSAMKSLSLCQQFCRNDGDALFRLGLCLDNAGKKEEAKQTYAMASRAGFKGQHVGMRVAKMRYSQGRFQEALSAIDMDLKKDSRDAEALFVKGEILFEMKQSAAAAQSMLEAARIGPCKETLALRVSQILTRRQFYKEAFSSAILVLGCPHTNKEQMDESKKNVVSLMKHLNQGEQVELVKAVSAQVMDSNYCRYLHLALGDIYDNLGKPELAVQYYRLAVRSCPNILSDRLSLARGLYRLGRDYEYSFRDFTTALNYYQEAYLLVSEDSEITANYERLKSRLQKRKNDFSWQFKDAWLNFWSRSRARPN